MQQVNIRCEQVAPYTSIYKVPLRGGYEASVIEDLPREIDYEKMNSI